MSMERRLLLAMVLAVGVLVVWQMLFSPTRPLPPPDDGDLSAGMQDATDENPLRATDGSGSGVPGGMARTALGVPGETMDRGLSLGTAEAVVGEEAVRIITLETDDVLVMISNRGGRPQSWRLKTYKDDKGRNLELISDSARAADVLPLDLLLDDAALQQAAGEALYKMERKITSSGQDGVVLTWSDGLGRTVRKEITIGPGFSASIQVEVRQDGVLLPVALTWGAGFGEEAKKGGSAGTFHYGGRALLSEKPRPRRMTAGSLEVGEMFAAGEREWGGLEDTYFMAVFLPVTTTDFRVFGLELPVAGSQDTNLALQVAAGMSGGSMELYVGPKDYRILAAMERGLQEAVHFQSGIWVIGPLVTLISQGLFYALIYLFTHVVANWGWAIVLLTAAIKFAFWPITQKAMLSMKRMQEKTKRIQPKIAALKEKYRKKSKKDIDSRGKLNQETMALYQKEGINPMGNLGGCLPLLLQMPILYGFYNLLQVAIELRHAPWLLWVTDLSQADPTYILPIVMGGSMVFQQVLTGAAIADPAQRKMMYMTPVLFTFFFLNLPSGLVLYWLVNNLLGIVQQWFINRRYEKEKVAAATSGRHKSAPSKS